MNREEKDPPIQNSLERILTSPRLIGTGDTSTCPGTNQRVPEN
jgi:hypothetical protein